MSEALSETIADRSAETERRKPLQKRGTPDYREISEIKAAIERTLKMEAEGEEIARWFLYDPGKKLHLEVEVTDPQVARAMLGSSFSDSPLMPGFKIRVIRFDDLERKDVLKAWLKQQLEMLEQSGATPPTQV